jgi:2-C-methyl-D-erythritol 4-phosphate cytidylyltransferase
MGGKVPKQYLLLGGRSVLSRTLSVFEGMPEVGSIVVVVPNRYRGRTERLVIREGFRKIVSIVSGGAERQSSVRLGLEAFPEPPELVLVHDAVRPFIRRKVVREVIRAARRHGAAVVGVKVTDTIKEASSAGFYRRTLDRTRLWAVQTPQGFRYNLLRAAHAEASKRKFVGTDEASLVERMGLRVRIVEGDSDNLKITRREDLRIAKRRLK